MTADPQDSVLVQGALAGDARAQTALVARHRERVYRLARSATGDAEDALDITQDVFIAAFTALPRYDQARPFRSWISAITLNRCRDWARRRAVRRFLGLALPDDAADWASDDSPLPDEVAEQRNALAQTARLIANLPPNLKDVLLLRTIEGLSQQETADTLGISVKAVETRLYRARQKLEFGLRDNSPTRV